MAFPDGWYKLDATWKQHFFEEGQQASLCGLVFRSPPSGRRQVTPDPDDMCAHCAGVIIRGRDESDKCPNCRQPAYLLATADRFFHLDGSDNRHCWLRISRGEA